MVTVTWHGHCLFQVEGSATVATDPHDGESLGLPVPRFKADIVTLSHSHKDHASGISLFQGATVLSDATEATVKGVHIKGVECHHDDDKGRRLGSNLVWTFNVDGVRFTHTGDLGHHLSVRQLSELGPMDVLFLNTGSNLPLVEENIVLLNPRIVVPMHYETPGIVFPWFKMKSVEEFTEGKQRAIQVGRSHEYTSETLPIKSETHVYSPPKL